MGPLGRARLKTAVESMAPDGQVVRYRLAAHWPLGLGCTLALRALHEAIQRAMQALAQGSDSGSRLSE
jgi:hypothetical protein